MAYNNNIPQPTDQLSVSQGQILANFQEIATAFNLNHGPFNSGLGIEGMHAFVQMPTSATPLATAMGQVGIYSASYSVTNQPELYFQRQNLIAGSGQPVSAKGVNITPSGGTSPVSFTYLLSGMLITWGIATTNGSGVANFLITDGTSIPAYSASTNIMTIYATPTNSNATKNICLAAAPNSLSPGNTIVVNSYNGSSGAAAANIQFQWMAIGLGA